jgi:hypothetical protein
MHTKTAGKLFSYKISVHLNLKKKSDRFRFGLAQVKIEMFTSYFGSERFIKPRVLEDSSNYLY